MVHAENSVMRVGLESIIRSNKNLEVVGSSSNAVSLLKQVKELQPDVVLLEWLRDDDEPLWETLETVGSGLSSPAIVVLADSEYNDWAADALNKGVRAILPRRSSTDEIIAAVVAAAVGLVVLHSDLIEDLLPLKESPGSVLPTLPIQALTSREIEVLGMLALGLGNKTIASRLGISEHTVKFHVSSIFTKLNASSRTEAVTLGARLGLILL
jgi:DNA-binding NarL/FixJ family response regulator